MPKFADAYGLKTGFLLRLPPRPPEVAVAAALLGKGLQFYKREQGADVVGGVKHTGNYGRTQSPGQVVKVKGGFNSPRLVKGQLVNERKRSHVVRFMFNPTEIGRTDGWDWGDHKVPGASHPILGGGTGAARTISFTIYLDGDRGRLESRKSSQTGPGVETQPDPGGRRNQTDAERGNSAPHRLDLTDEINAYRAFTYPAPREDSPAQLLGPDTAIFSYGPLFPGVRVVVREASPSVMAMTPDLRPMRATISIVLQEIVARSVNSENFVIGQTSSTSEDFDQVTGGRVIG